MRVRCSLTGPWLAKSASRSASSAVTAAAGIFSTPGGVHGHAGVGDAIVSSADRADEHGGGSDRGACDRRGGAVLHGIAVGVDAAFLGGKLLVELVIEEEDLSLKRRGVEGFQRGPVVDCDDFGGETIGWSGDAAAERGEDHFLRGARSHALPIDQLRRSPRREPSVGRRFFRA